MIYWTKRFQTYPKPTYILNPEFNRQKIITKDVKFWIQNQNPRMGTDTGSREACTQTPPRKIQPQQKIVNLVPGNLKKSWISNILVWVSLWLLRTCTELDCVETPNPQNLHNLQKQSIMVKILSTLCI